MTDEEHPELMGYVPLDSGPLRSRRTTQLIRFVVVLGLVALILPGIITTIAVATDTATRTCSVYVKRYAPSANGSSVSFQLFSPGGPGWQCYSTNTEGDQTYLAPLGLIPSAPLPPQRQISNS
jgi:hypothetical protein